MYKNIKDSIIKVKTIIIRCVKWFFGIIGVMAFILWILSFTDVPFNAYHHLGTVNADLSKNPDIIAVLSGSGMPSPDGLIRIYYATEAAFEYPDASIIIAFPISKEDSLHQLDLMANEMILKGIDSTRIQYESEGFNTYSQAMNIASLFSNKDTLSLMIITTPEHMYRSVKTFEKAGFTDVGGSPCFEKPIEEDLLKDKEKRKDLRVKNLDVRYNMWSYLNYELLVMREYCAILYYKVKGWI